MEVFFYGLFMDVDILMKNGVKPSNPRRANLDNYTLKIGDRASLVPSEGEKAYGIVMTIDRDELYDLYSESSVADYVPEEVSVITDANEVVKASCYNLPSHLLTGTNKTYAASLYHLAQRLGFPDEYLDKIKAMT